MSKSDIEKLAEKYYKDLSHAKEVKRLSVLIFDEINKKIIPLDNKKQSLLCAAAMLHDIGYAVEAEDHHKYSEKLILKNEINDFSEDDIKIIANIARYHRGKIPNEMKHKKYSQFNSEQKNTVNQLASILRVADALDKIHVNVIKNIELHYDKQNNICKMFLISNISGYVTKLKSAEKKKDLFEKTYDTTLCFEFKNN